MTQVNVELLQAERTLTDAGGLPGRPWYKHQLYAPGFYTGYGVKTVPGVREAVDRAATTAKLRLLPPRSGSDDTRAERSPDDRTEQRTTQIARPFGTLLDQMTRARSAPRLERASRW